MVPARFLERTVSTAPFILFAAIYLPTAGHGFIKDDFAWILDSRVRSFGDLLEIFRSDNGFYRPIVALTFAANEQTFGVNPLPYGITNVTLALLCAAAIFSLARAFDLPRGAAVLASALWLLNFHGIRMAVLWISGRTSLVLTLAATLAAASFVRGRIVIATMWLLVALFSKEEAVLLPAILLSWLFVLRAGGREPPVRPIVWTGISVAALALYFVARSATQAMTPSTAPSYYRPTFDIAALFENVLRYADRVGTFPIVVLLLSAVMLGFAKSAVRDPPLRATLQCGAAWVVGGFGLTVFAPVRSDLYACFPSVGVCLIVAALVARSWQSASDARQKRALVAALLLLAALSPVHYLRTVRWVSLAEFSARVLEDLRQFTVSLPQNATVVVEDDRRTRVNIGSAFGTLLNEAYFVTTNRRLVLWVEPPVPDAALAGLTPPCATCVSLRLKVSTGGLRSASGK